jgi:peptidoglycan/LPS O-acetylase OafA/YrhL
MRGLERSQPLDGLRAVAIVLVVVLHGALPYVDPPLGSLPWAIRDATSDALTHVFWWLHGFLMPLFFLLAGVLAAQVEEQRGARAFVRRRTKRILAPFLVGCLVLLPVTFYVFATGWWLGGHATWDEIRRVKFAPPIQAELFGPAHLWFLEYLYVYCVFYAAFAALRRLHRSTATPAPEPRARRPASVWHALWCATATACIVALDPDIFASHRNAFIPAPLRLLHYAVFFAAGVGLYARRAALPHSAQRGAICLVLSVPMALLVEALVHGRQIAAVSLADRVAFAIAVALLAWLAIVGSLSVATMVCARPHRLTRRLADASYWIYLTHLPLLAALQIGLTEVSAPPVLKCLVASAVTVVVCLGAYERLVQTRHAVPEAAWHWRQIVARAGAGGHSPLPAPPRRRS